MLIYLQSIRQAITGKPIGILARLGQKAGDATMKSKLLQGSTPAHEEMHGFGPTANMITRSARARSSGDIIGTGRLLGNGAKPLGGP